MTRLIDKIMSKKMLTEMQAKQVVIDMMDGKTSQEEMAAILSLLQYRGETIEEIVGFAKGMLEKSEKISLPFSVLDTCGTGGDGANTFNISTAVAILLSSMGIKVAKHGNRGVSSKSGSADVLEELGIPFQRNQQEAEKMLTDHHLTFLFAPVYHSAMKNVAPVRKKLAIKTIFNLLGPLTNPAGATHRMIGVYHFDVARKMAQASLQLGIKRALFVCGEDGLDEMTVQGKTNVAEVNNGEIHEYSVTPEEVGLSRQPLKGASVETPKQSAEMIQSIFRKEASEAAINLVLLNAGASLYIQGSALTIKEGVEECKKALGDPVIQHLVALRNAKEVSTTL